MTFRDRQEVGRLLAERLRVYAHGTDTVVLALPRGGVPVAYEIALTLGLPLDVFVVRKLGTPGQRELAMGAVASGGVRVLNADVVRELGIDTAAVDRATAQEFEEVRYRERLYRGDQPPRNLGGQTLIFVDDGVATGSTVRAAIASARAQKPRDIVIAVPIAARATAELLATEADRVVCLVAVEQLHAVGLWYEDFSQVSHEEVRRLIDEAATISTRQTAARPGPLVPHAPHDGAHAGRES